MYRIPSILLAVLCSSTLLFSQSSYLNKPELMAMADSCLKHTYNFSFSEARQYLEKLQQLTPRHPAPPFLEALILYWEEFPLTPENKNSDTFIRLMENSVTLSADMIQDKNMHLEGVFFDLFGRAFQVMFWADNGKSGKAIPNLGPMYGQTKEGFLLKDQYTEFYFSTGLYNYYIEAYSEAHPMYKPVLTFMHKGNMELGLKQLNYAIENTTFLKVESLLFMALIQLYYEEDLKTAALYAERLHRLYPRNTYYQGLLVIIQLHREKYSRAEEIIMSMVGQADSYSRMILLIADATLAENSDDFKNAERKYLSSIELAESIGPFADIYQAIGYMGLSSLSRKKGMGTEANRFARMAANHTRYAFILGE